MPPTAHKRPHTVDPDRRDSDSDDKQGATPAARNLPTVVPEANRDEFRQTLYTTWLSWASQMVAGVCASALFDQHDGELSQPVLWPDEAFDTTLLVDAAREVARSGDLSIQSRIRTADSTSPLNDIIAIPVVSDSSSCVLAVQLKPRSREQQDAVVQLLQWVTVWLDSVYKLSSARYNDATDSQAKLLDVMLRHQSMHAASVELVNQLAARFDCERVSFGQRNRLLIEMVAISQTVEFDARKQLVRRIEASMEEALDQESAIVLPQTEDAEPRVVRAHEELIHSLGVESICTVPFEVDDGVMGAVTLERSAEKPFNVDTIKRISSMLLEVRPALVLMRKLEQPWHRRLYASAKSSIKGVLKKSGIHHRVVAAVSSILVLVLAMWPVSHKVVARASVEGADQQQLVAPETGFIKAVYASAGDKVSEGQVIATFEDSDLLLEKDKWINEMKKLESGYIQALASKERVELGVMQSRKRQAQAELDLIEQRLARSELHAPFDGVLVSGDLSQALGSPVAAGQLLFEVASLDAFRLILEFDEHDVAGVETGKTGELRISALPGKTYEARLKSAIPVAATSRQKTVFRMEASLQSMDHLRPGMQGYARINMGKRLLVDSLTRSLRQRLTLWLWKLGWVR